MKTTLTEQLILGILSESPQHGYNIEKLFEKRGMLKWTDIGLSSIYYVLEKLEKKGLATSEDTIGKEKKLYHITKTGMQVLQDETKNLIAIRKPSNTHLMTGLSNSHIITEDEMKNSLKERKKQLEEDLNSLQVKMSNDEKLPVLAQRLFSLSKTLIKSELEWINKELERSKK